MSKAKKTTWAQIPDHFRMAAVLADELDKQEQRKEALSAERVRVLVRLQRAVETWEKERRKAT